MATALAGHGGAVKTNGTPVTTVALIDQWQGTLTAAQYDQTALGDSWTSDVSGLLTLTGTISGSWDVASDAGQTALHNAILNGTTVGLDLLTDSANSHGYEGTFRLDSFQTQTPANGKVSFTCNFRSQGQVYFE